MAITGLPKLGGTFSNGGAAEGNYRTEVADAQISEASTGRPQVVLDLTVRNDPNHPSKEGKRLTKMYQSLPQEGDDPENAKVTKGIIKRLIFDGFGLEWAKDEKPFDPRVLVGKMAWVQIAKKKDNKGIERSNVVAISQTAEGLPIPRVSPEAIAAKGGAKSGAKNGASARRR